MFHVDKVVLGPFASAAFTFKFEAGTVVGIARDFKSLNEPVVLVEQSSVLVFEFFNPTFRTFKRVVGGCNFIGQVHTDGEQIEELCLVHGKLESAELRLRT